MKSLQIKQSITDRSDTALKSYLKDVNRYPLLTVDEEKELGKKIKEGDKNAFNKLVTSNLRFVISVAKQYQGQGIDLIDLIQEGNEGLIEATKKWDVDKGFKFISYAVWWIRQKIVLALSNKSRMIRIPTSQIVLLQKINKMITDFEVKNERSPSDAEISKLTGIPEYKIPNILAAITRFVSVDSPISDDESTMVDIIPNKNSISSDYNLIEESKNNEIDRIINILTPREQDIIRMYFGLRCDPMTLDNISNKFGITNERTRQIKDGAIKALKNKYLNKVKDILSK